ncbi:MAG TPA: hypothetical protein VE974_23155 [Thermoanaerobaculia bacterium]|nr:hypothetical protein [Thermoanaerobaculia bacterium]
MKKQLILASVVLSLFTAFPALAQSKACVYMAPGVWYAGMIRGSSPSWTDGTWQGQYELGKFGCVELSRVPDGEEFTIHIRPLAPFGAKDGACPKVKRLASSGPPVLFFATGTIFEPRCVLYEAQ